MELSVTKEGGNNEKITSNRYKLSLFDKQGQEVQVDVCGIDKMTSEIQSVDIAGIIPLFNNISKEDVLIGYEYASRLDYQPLFGKMRQHSSPERAAGRVRFPLLV